MSAAETFWRAPMTDGKTFSIPASLGGLGEPRVMQWDVGGQEYIGQQLLGMDGIHQQVMAQYLQQANPQLDQMAAMAQQAQVLHQQQWAAQALAAQQLRQGLMAMPVVRGNMRDLLLPGLRSMGGHIPAEILRAYRNVGLGGYYPSSVSVETAARSKERARGLLKSLLSPAQWDEFQRIGRVTERIAECEFTLTPGGMIEARKPRLIGAVKERWCVAPDPYAPNPDGSHNDWMPEEDKLIGQLLHLRAGPDKLRAQANVFPA